MSSKCPRCKEEPEDQSPIHDLKHSRSLQEIQDSSSWDKKERQLTVESVHIDSEKQC